ncbi:hypothetical protein BZJ17_15845 [Salinivibrio sp. IB574]|uniref:hypothetical protein n=1 Tax=Salinivibrio sp. IB574 TaxID=1909444 RepID=UPI000988C9EB|nr:hypothetical protein [Salinivibrio sp. IB574]OOF18869.1 hypothetical protein BZJ17_15845 [Salinivibrio sp. IB574]
MTKKYTSLRVSEETKLKLERAAIEVSYATGKQVKWTEVANYLFDQYLTEAKKDLKESVSK